jgi:hypothetical protein
MPHPAIAVFTGNSADEILATGGSASWVVNAKHARQRRYLVCTRNARAVGFADAEPHGAAFLIGVIKDVRHVGFDAKGLRRWAIDISEYAPLMVPNAWKEWRNPVKYTTLEELGVDLKGVELRPMPAPTRTEGPIVSAARPLTIAQAKEGLSLQFGVPVEAIEIVIRA